MGSLMQIVSSHAIILKENKLTKIRFEKLRKEQKKNPNKQQVWKGTSKLTDEEKEEIRDIKTEQKF